MSDASAPADIDLKVVTSCDLGQELKQFRCMEINLGQGRKGILAAYGADRVVDPWVEMFFFPTDTLKLVVFTLDGDVLWRKDLGRGVVPGGHFCPILAFDLDGDGVDEIWYVDNLDPDHPLSIRNRCLRRLDAQTGESTGHWPWLWHVWGDRPSHQFRNFILGGKVHGDPVLVTAQGTYTNMRLEGWLPSMEQRWDVKIAADAPGARGSHMSPIVDINNDGVDELMWGERCIELDTGRELFCCDRDSYRGHSDVIQPVWDQQAGRWFIYTCRESDNDASPRVALFDDRGRRVWGAVDTGHMDMGWTARIGPDMRHVAMAIRIGGKSLGPDGLFHESPEQFAFDALSGSPVELAFDAYRTRPVDINGDGYHEFVRVGNDDGCEVLSSKGNTVGQVPGRVALAKKFCDLPGEQLLSYHSSGQVQIIADANASDSEEALARYGNGFYRPAQPVAGI